MQLATVELAQMLAGANRALVGEEIVQFAKAEPLGGGHWRLSGLLRGRGGTEHAVAGHGSDEGFVLLGPGLVPLDPAVLGTDPARRVVALGRGDPAPVKAPVLLRGLGLRPLSPVRPRRTVAADGSWTLAWTRRARGGWSWRGGVDMPLVEEAESYLVTLGPLEAPFETFLATWTTATPLLRLEASTLADLAARNPGAPIAVRQRGTASLSLPLLLCHLP
ncbi:hypothetical protein ACFSQV_17955 [Novosphingobium soli]